MDNIQQHLVFLNEQYEKLKLTGEGSRGYVVSKLINDVRHAVTGIETAKKQETFVGTGRTGLDDKILADRAVMLELNSHPEWGLVPYYHIGWEVLENIPAQIGELFDMKKQDPSGELSRMLFVGGDHDLIAYPEETEKPVDEITRAKIKMMFGNVEAKVTRGKLGYLPIEKIKAPQNIIEEIRKEKSWYLHRLGLRDSDCIF